MIPGTTIRLGFSAVSFAAMLFAAAMLEAADRQPWWSAPAVRTALSLTSHQVAQLDSIYRESLPRRRSLRRQFAAQQKRVADMLSRGTFDDEQVGPVVGRLFAIDKERNVARVLMLIRMYRVLTPMQRTKLEQLSAEVPGDRTPDALVGLLSGKE